MRATRTVDAKPRRLSEFVGVGINAVTEAATRLNGNNSSIAWARQALERIGVEAVPVTYHGASFHEVSLIDGRVVARLRTSIKIMRPCWQTGHCHREAPERSSWWSR